MATVKNNGPIIDPALCRCCRAIKKCRILTAEYTWMEQKEVYADMIMDCFGILDDLSEHSGGIDNEDNMSIGYPEELEEPKPPKKEESLDKTEVPDEDLKLGEDDDDDSDWSGSSSDSDKPIKKKAKKKGKTNGAQKKKKTAVKKTKAGTSTKKSPKAIKKPPVEKKNNYDRDLDCMSEENLLTIIQYSYVCPFKNRRNNYYCFYCKDYYPKPEDLREHTVSHDTKPFQLLMGYKKMIKIDITRIDCRLCPMKIDDLNVFKQHIDQVHGKKIYFEAPDKMLLYKLTWNDLVCVMCNDVFEDFNTLNTHMVEHFSNYTCDICGVCFLEKPRLDAHLKRHKDDERHTCEVCGKVFKSNHYKDMHVDIVHKKKAIIRCPRCDECFMSYALKNKHLTEAHGQKRTYPCNLCDKVYNRQKTLTEHQRRNHQKVLKHQCEYCDQRFYLPSRLKEHMATHTGERNFRCEYCEKSYPRLKSLQYHIRTHTNDRRYRCHICGQAFIQNASLKSHIKSHHPECDIEGCYF
ncbi:hypothetical protein HF086_009547 [Spodoptera exigua]|uniref:C2H2-type domain-containing protein n=1 Tax=Spodoptera exigua TaxID=7107 RepID=A0A922SEE2_SPOEX|nr:hypothetical protein HF086_009547 [Spodoptera exigua]